MENRRKFLRNVGLTSLSFGLLPSLTKASNSKAPFLPVPPPCDITTLDYYGEGPFYTAGTPSLTDGYLLAPISEPGERLIISGVVRTLDCTEIIRDAVIDIWQADDSGDYDNTGYHLRGQTTSNISGIYMFETIKPGKYLNGASYRPSHIHIKVTAPGFSTFTTQIYFEGDDSIPGDAAASITSGTYDATNRIIELTTNVDEKLEGNWDIVIDGDGIDNTGIDSLHIEHGMIYGASPNPFSDTLEIKYGVFTASVVSISVTDLQGRVVAEITEENHAADKYTAVWNPKKELPNGVYFVLIKINGLQVHHLKVVRNASSY